MSDAAFDVDGETILGVAFERALRAQFDPVGRGVVQPLVFVFERGAASEVATFEGKLFGIIAFEEAGVHYCAAEDSGETEAKDTPVVSGSTATAGFPAVHPLSACGVFA